MTTLPLIDPATAAVLAFATEVNNTRRRERLPRRHGLTRP